MVGGIYLFYSSQSIEDVASLDNFFSSLMPKLADGALLFFETPNDSSIEFLGDRPDTPHTYFLSERSFRLLAERYSLKVILAERTGRMWGDGLPNIPRDVDDQRNLRVVLRK
jgi:hypothetical protein